MIVVSGTKRSGTSMWMQVLGAAGVPRMGDPFPHNWAHTIAQANRGGFYESPLRRGIFWATNPDPRTGVYVSAEAGRGVAIKVFAGGLVKSEREYLERVIVCVRHWRAYSASLARLYALEREAKQRRLGVELPARQRIPAPLEWWDDNFRVVRDVASRAYPARFVSYDAAVERPDAVVREVLSFAAPGCDVDAGVGVVSITERTQTRGTAHSAPLEWEPDAHTAQVMDAWYDAVHAGLHPDRALIESMNRVDEALRPTIQKAKRVAARSRRAAREFEASLHNAKSPGGKAR